MVVHESYAVPLGEHGQIELPEEIRQALGVEPGDLLVLRLVDGAWRLESGREIARRAAGLYKDVAAGRSLVDELIAERREEARRENEEW